MKRRLGLVLLMMVLVSYGEEDPTSNVGSAPLTIPETSLQEVDTTPVETAPAAPAVPVTEASAIQRLMTAEPLALDGPVVNSVGIVLIPIPPGEFTTGSPASEAVRLGGETPRLVKITKSFYLSTYEVTQEQYVQVTGKSPSKNKGVNKPVERVNWHDAIEFCHNLSEQEGEEYRIPTEAEWEYACRAGTTTAYSFENEFSELGEYAWYDDNSKGTTHTVGRKLSNAWGLYDMHGNVWEWCQDWYGWYGTKAVVNDPTGPASGEYRVLRGGAFNLRPKLLQSANRAGSLRPPNYRVYTFGFRLAKTYNISP